jgi:ubiquinone/menaquinone biosynthesis C-methylase UbiE
VKTFGDHLFDTAMSAAERGALGVHRNNLVSRVTGAVLEIGTGTGANLAHYSFERIRRLVQLDVDVRSPVLSHRFPDSVPVSFVQGRAEALPFADASFDAVVFTLVFCSVGEPRRGLDEVFRVLRPGGRAYFMEHVEPSHPVTRSMSHLINPLWRVLAAGCNLTRRTLGSIRHAGFEIEELDSFGGEVFWVGVARKPDAA